MESSRGPHRHSPALADAELRQLLLRKPNPVAYDGFEPSGRMHIAQVSHHHGPGSSLKAVTHAVVAVHDSQLTYGIARVRCLTDLKLLMKLAGCS